MVFCFTRWKGSALQKIPRYWKTAKPLQRKHFFERRGEKGHTMQGRRAGEGRGRLVPSFPLRGQRREETDWGCVWMFPEGWVGGGRGKPPIQQGSLLKSKALTEVEHAESAYVQAI